MQKGKLKVLFISRAYPPIHGGIEDQNYNLGKTLQKITTTKIIANKKGKKNLPFFLLYLFFYLPFILNNYDIVLFGDGVLAPVGRFFKTFFKKIKFISVIHGLDITYVYQKSTMGKIYRFVNIPALKKLDKLIMVGRHTIKEAIKVGIAEEKCVFIPNGVDFKKVYKPHKRIDLEKLLTKETGWAKEYFINKKIILRVGRFVPHKGLHWFIDKVMPKLPKDYILVGAGGYNSKAVGDQENYTLCKQYIKKHNLEKRVVLFPNVTQTKMNILFNTVDLYVSPNINIKGSMEGFGINVLEAVVCNRIVLAADLQGLKDAIKNNVNGFLIEPENVQAWQNKIEEVLSPKFNKKEFIGKARRYTLENFSWEKIGNQYLEEFKIVIKGIKKRGNSQGIFTREGSEGREERKQERDSDIYTTKGV